MKSKSMIRIYDTPNEGNWTILSCVTVSYTGQSGSVHFESEDESSSTGVAFLPLIIKGDSSFYYNHELLRCDKVTAQHFVLRC